MRWPEGPPHITKPFLSGVVSFCFLLASFSILVLVWALESLGGGPTSPNPSFFVYVGGFFCCKETKQGQSPTILVEIGSFCPKPLSSNASLFCFFFFFVLSFYLSFFIYFFLSSSSCYSSSSSSSSSSPSLFFPFNHSSSLFPFFFLLLPFFFVTLSFFFYFLLSCFLNFSFTIFKSLPQTTSHEWQQNGVCLTTPVNFSKVSKVSVSLCFPILPSFKCISPKTLFLL